LPTALAGVILAVMVQVAELEGFNASPNVQLLVAE
jgi:hypothetical protein